MQTDRYWSNFKEMKYVLALLGLLSGLLICMAGRLLLNYVIFAMTIVACIAASNLMAYAIAGSSNGLSSSVFWVTFVVGSACGFLLAWASIKYRAGGASIITAWTGFNVGVSFANLVYF